MFKGQNFYPKSTNLSPFAGQELGKNPFPPVEVPLHPFQGHQEPPALEASPASNEDLVLIQQGFEEYPYINIILQRVTKVVFVTV